MPLISAFYKITSATDFVDVELNRDNRVFIDPSAVRNLASSSSLASSAQDRLISFFSTVLDCIYSTSVLDHARGEALLQSLHEIKEIRLGWSKNGFDGRGAAEELGTVLWNVLRDHPVVQIKALTRLEHVPLFVSGVGIDLISDFSARIAFEQLALFTANQMALHPELQLGKVVVPHLIWDTATTSWIEVDVELPSHNGKPVVLVPKLWVRRSLMMRPESYYNVTVIGQIRSERGVKTDKGTIRYPYKKDIKQEPGLDSARDTNTSQTVTKWESGLDLIERYRARVDGAFSPLTEEEIKRAVLG